MRIVVGFSLLLIFSFLFGMYILVPPSTYLSQIEISWWPKPVVKSILEKRAVATLSVMADSRETKVKYSDLGISLHPKKTMASLVVNDVGKLLDRWLNPKTTLIQPVFDFPEDMESRMEKIFPARELKNETYYLDEKTGLFVYLTDSRKARVDFVDLQVKLITFTDTDNKPISVEMVEESSELERKIEVVNRKLKNVYKEPIDLIVDEVKKITIFPKDVITLVQPQIKEKSEDTEIEIDQDGLKKFLSTNSLSLATNWATKLLKDSAQSRFRGEKTEAIVLGSDSGPNSDGSLANKYIEVDLSQQRMFFFEDHNLTKTYKVSTGLNYPTPEGSYKIQNKIPMGFSSIFGVWMPWWMAFDYREDIGAYLGIHELPYKLNGDEKIYRFGNYIGNRKTGGCIALAPGDSKEVYDKSFPGMDLVIYQ